MRVFLLLAALTGCTHTTTSTELYNDSELLKRISNLEFQLKFEWYDRAMDKCFIEERMCRLEKKPECWPKHEACVLSVAGRWKLINPK